jgi:hypothetical protein
VKVTIDNPDELIAFIGTVKVTFLSYPFPLLEPLVPCDGLRMLTVKRNWRDESVYVSEGVEPIRTMLTCTSSCPSTTPHWKKS